MRVALIEEDLWEATRLLVSGVGKDSVQVPVQRGSLPVGMTTDKEAFAKVANVQTVQSLRQNL